MAGRATSYSDYYRPANASAGSSGRTQYKPPVRTGGASRPVDNSEGVLGPNGAAPGQRPRPGQSGSRPGIGGFRPGIKKGGKSGLGKYQNRDDDDERRLALKRRLMATKKSKGSGRKSK